MLDQIWIWSCPRSIQTVSKNKIAKLKEGFLLLCLHWIILSMQFSAPFGQYESPTCIGLELSFGVLANCSSVGNSSTDTSELSLTSQYRFHALL